jgi:prepilin-type N-terminal cleavage/methylation domain-containing protein
MLNVRLPKFCKKGIARNQKGFTLIEVLVAVVMIGIITGGVIMVISTSTKILISVKNKETAKDIASTEMEYIRSQPYSDYGYTMPALPAIYSNFVVPSPTITPLNMNEQQIDIYVYLNGTQIFQLTDYRVNY